MEGSECLIVQKRIANVANYGIGYSLPIIQTAAGMKLQFHLKCTVDLARTAIGAVNARLAMTPTTGIAEPTDIG
jgi:hypothetical protein